MRVAVVGSGPAGFYVAGPLLAAGAGVDLIERLPTPWGLVRLGVAPDHPEIKAVSRVFEKTAKLPGFRFFGNVEVGRDVTQAELARLYDAVVYTVGAQTDRRIGIPGEDLPGSWPATAFVAWYNGHPDFQGLDFDLSGERAIVVGNGNVAVDVARMLALTREELAPTDTTDAAIEAIVGSGIREIVMLGRRGPAQAAFTNPELKELGELAGADVIVDPADLELDPASEAALADGSRDRAPQLRAAARVRGAPSRGQAASGLLLRFRASPVAILGDGRVEAVEVVRNALVADEDGRVRAVPTGESETIPCGIVLRSVGYRGVALPGVPFDESRGVDPERRRPGGRRGGPADPRPLLRRLDQARPERRHRHEQQGRDRDRRAPARGRRRRVAARGGRRSGAAARRARRRARRLRGLGGDRRARVRARGRAGPPARQALHLGRAARLRSARRLDSKA